METGWLIERIDGGPPMWWTGRSLTTSAWTEDSLEAVRFARKQDAETVLELIQRQFIAGIDLSATEHQWG